MIDRSESPAAYRARIFGRLDAHMGDCRRARLKLEAEAAARAAQLDLVADEDIEPAAIQGAA